MNLKAMLDANDVLYSLPLSRQLKDLDVSQGFEVFTKPGEVATEVMLVKEATDLNSLLVITISEHHVHCHCIEFGKVVANNVIIDKTDINLELFKFMTRTEGKVLRQMSSKHLLNK